MAHMGVSGKKKIRKTDGHCPEVSKVLCRFVGSRHLVGFAKPRVAAYGRCWKAWELGNKIIFDTCIMLYPCCLACFSWWLWLFTSDFWCLIHFVDSQTWIVYIYHIIYIYMSHACWLYHYKTWIVSLEKPLQHQNFAWKTALFHWIEFTWTTSRLWRTNPSP
jgi:hypothetical protein